MRPGYTPLPRPHDRKRQAPMPEAPDSLPGVAAVPAMARLAHRKGLTLAEVDERCSVEDVLDEIDMAAYLFDVDAEPEGPPTHSTPNPAGIMARR